MKHRQYHKYCFEIDDWDGNTAARWSQAKEKTFITEGFSQSVKFDSYRLTVH